MWSIVYSHCCPWVILHRKITELCCAGTTSHALINAILSPLKIQSWHDTEIGLGGNAKQPPVHPTKHHHQNVSSIGHYFVLISSAFSKTHVICILIYQCLSAACVCASHHLPSTSRESIPHSFSLSPYSVLIVTISLLTPSTSAVLIFFPVFAIFSYTVSKSNSGFPITVAVWPLRSTSYARTPILLVSDLLLCQFYDQDSWQACESKLRRAHVLRARSKRGEEV